MARPGVSRPRNVTLGSPASCAVGSSCRFQSTLDVRFAIRQSAHEDRTEGPPGLFDAHDADFFLELLALSPWTQGPPRRAWVVLEDSHEEPIPTIRFRSG